MSPGTTHTHCHLNKLQIVVFPSEVHQLLVAVIVSPASQELEEELGWSQPKPPQMSRWRSSPVTALCHPGLSRHVH